MIEKQKMRENILLFWIRSHKEPERKKNKDISQLFGLWSLFGIEEFTCPSGAAVPEIICEFLLKN